jgi:hypothetical protein
LSEKPKEERVPGALLTVGEVGDVFEAEGAIKRMEGFAETDPLGGGGSSTPLFGTTVSTVRGQTFRGIFGKKRFESLTELPERSRTSAAQTGTVR